MLALTFMKTANRIIDKETADALIDHVRAHCIAEFQDHFWQGSTRSEDYKEMAQSYFAAGVEIGANRLITILLQELQADLKQL